MDTSQGVESCISSPGCFDVLRFKIASNALKEFLQLLLHFLSFKKTALHFIRRTHKQNGTWEKTLGRVQGSAYRDGWENKLLSSHRSQRKIALWAWSCLGLGTLWSHSSLCLDYNTMILTMRRWLFWCNNTCSCIYHSLKNLPGCDT